MIGNRRSAGRGKLLGDPFRLVAARGIDDARARLAGEQRFQLRIQTVARADVVADVRTVEAGDDQPVLGNAELRQDVGSRPRVGGCGQREPRHVGIVVEQRAELAIIGPEIVAPFADAMRFVDGDQRQVHAADQTAEGFARRTLRRDVQQVQFAGLEPLDGLFAVGIGRSQRSGPQADRIRASDLVVHQRDQRGNDERSAFAGDRGKLIAERLARAGRHHRERVLAGKNAVDDLFLHAAEMIEAEDGLV